MGCVRIPVKVARELADMASYRSSQRWDDEHAQTGVCLFACLLARLLARLFISGTTCSLRLPALCPGRRAFTCCPLVVWDSPLSVWVCRGSDMLHVRVLLSFQQSNVQNFTKQNQLCVSCMVSISPERVNIMRCRLLKRLLDHPMLCMCAHCLLSFYAIIISISY